MNKGDKVVCINHHFPHIKEYGGTEIKQITPKKGDVLVIDEVLGEFLRFDLFDTEESFNWWHKSRFRKIDEAEESENESDKILNTLKG